MARISDYRLFWREFRRNFHDTGAIAPSGSGLCRALTHFVAQPGRERRVLEVGPGTGAVTARIVAALDPTDQFDLVEANERFVERLRERFASEPAFVRVAPRVRVLHERVESLPPGETYDMVISGLPLNNFSVADVELILATFSRLLKPGGTLSFFEYIAVRPARSLVGGRAERQRLRGIGQALEQTLSEGEIRRDGVWLNLPPAWVHHVRRK